MNRRKRFIAGSLAAIITFATLMVVAGPQRRYHRHMHQQSCEGHNGYHQQDGCCNQDSTAVIQ